MAHVNVVKTEVYAAIQKLYFITGNKTLCRTVYDTCASSHTVMLLQTRTIPTLNNTFCRFTYAM